MDYRIMLKNIIYVTHAEKGPSGGAKIIYKHSQIINNLKNYSSEVLHLRKKKTSKWKISINKRLKFQNNKESGWQFNQIEAVKNFSYNWFNHKIKIRDNLIFDSNKDFVILPEIFAHFAEDMLIKNKIKYAIFVQNGYVLNSTNNEKKLFNAYLKANFILSYSEDITNCIKIKFPNLKTKIIKISYSLDLDYKKKVKKKNIITYMSRKLPHQSNLVTSYLKSYLPKNWLLLDINQFNEKNTYQTLRKSKIFLAFSYLEGLPLPPAEAALAMNYVIGYTGEGGNEYWQRPIFTKINNGEIKNFVNSICSQISYLKKKRKFPIKQLLKLKRKFSKENELSNIIKFLKIIN